MILRSLAVLTLCLVAAPALAGDDLKLNPYGKVFVGEQGITVEVATLEATNKAGLHDALIRITGSAAHDAGIDGKVILHTAEHAGTGFDFVDNGYHRLITRKAWGTWEFFEVYLGKVQAKVYYDEKKSKELKVDDLAKAYKKKK
jgi:hypothetical protein